MARDASELARRLAREAEAVCRRYLSNGRREGGYWLVGDTANTPGRSLYVRLHGPERGKGAAGKWTDAATGEHGDLLDLIAANQGLHELRDVLEEAQAFLNLPRPQHSPPAVSAPAPAASPLAARRLYAMSKPIAGTLAERYLRSRKLTVVQVRDPLRFHRQCFYRPHAGRPCETWPAMIAAVTDLGGVITGIHRTWLCPATATRPPQVKDRRAMGALLGHGVRFGVANDVLAAGEGIETTLSLRLVMPAMPLIASLSAAHLGAMLFPPALRRLYVARDSDRAGDHAFETLAVRAASCGIEAIALWPRLGDFNDDLRCIGAAHLRARLAGQLAPKDAERFLATPMPGT
ncbi:MAG: DUF7146 domain-containing protein [Vitreimonas sp.]